MGSDQKRRGETRIRTQSGLPSRLALTATTSLLAARFLSVSPSVACLRAPRMSGNISDCGWTVSEVCAAAVKSTEPDP